MICKSFVLWINHSITETIYTIFVHCENTPTLANTVTEILMIDTTYAYVKEY